MPVRVVQSGETLVRIAEECGHSPYVIWDHQKNKQLKADRPNMNTLMPGDELFIPEKDPGDKECQTAKRHVFRRVGVPAILRVRVLIGGEVLANQPCLVVIDGDWRRMTSDQDGVLELYIPTGARRGRIVVESDGLKFPIELALGHVRPITELAGVQDRLGNLGYLSCPGSGEPDEQTTDAVRAFQRDFDLPETGTVDKATQDAIERAYATTEDLSDVEV